MGWGLEILWMRMQPEGLRLGIVDRVPMRHLAPVAAGYAQDEERQRLKAMLAEEGVQWSRELHHTLGVWRPWQRRPRWLRR